MKQNLIIVGAGGFFLELYDYFEQDIQFKNSINIKGVLEDSDVCSQNILPHLGWISKYEPSPDDIFIIAIGSSIGRSKCYDLLKSKNVNFLTYIHPSAIISNTAVIGEGCIIAPYTIINSHSKLGCNVVVNVHSSVGHEATIGSHSVLSPYSALNGKASIGSLCFLGTRATVFPRVSLGNKSIVDSHSYVKSDVPEKSIVSLRGEYVVVHNRLMR